MCCLSTSQRARRLESRKLPKMLLNASAISRYRKLADDLDAAMARGDELGMELLKNMLPELCEAIEEINEALRETDRLLFEGLRDEAIGLHDPELAAVALRLNLDDKPRLPELSLLCASEGIELPPAIDFAALSALNSAYSEVEQLRRPLDRLRRLALERAPLKKRIKLLRQLRSHDSSKPVWGDQVASHEEVRLLELNDAVKQAVRSRDPAAIAVLNEELTHPGWSVPVPPRLKHETGGADVWSALRSEMATLEPVALQLEAACDRINEEGADLFERLESLRLLRQRWVAGESRCRECIFTLPKHPGIVSLTLPEEFGQRLEALREKVAPALEWLSQVDQRDSLVQQFRQACNELELLTDGPPVMKNESKWMARVAKLEANLQQYCQQVTQLKIPESLQIKVKRAVADVQRRIHQRARHRIMALAGGAILALVVVAATAYLINERRARIAATEYVRELIRLAEIGEYVGRPELLEKYASRFGSHAVFAAALEEFDKLAELEQTRRRSFDQLVLAHEEALAQASRDLAGREEEPHKKLDEWPGAVLEAQDRYRAARLKGGFPKCRKSEGTGTPNKPADAGDDLPPSVRQRFEDEETRLAEQAEKQSRIEQDFANAASEEFGRQLQQIEKSIPAFGSPDAGERAKSLLELLDQTLDKAKMRRSDAKSSSRVSYNTLDSAIPVRLRLERLVKASVPPQ